MAKGADARLLQDLRQVVEQHREQALPRETEHVLYHYTDATGLFGILTTHKLWMKADDETRDPLELRYANHVFDEAWSRFARSDDLLAGMAKRDVNPFAPEGDGAPSNGTYFVSFCKHGDIPHHWQNFASGGRGFSVGLRFKKGASDWTTSGDRKTKLWLGPVIYDRQVQGDLVEGVLKRARSLRQHYTVGERSRAVRHVLSELLPFFKHASFREENEWRLVTTRAANLTSKAARIQALDGRLAAVLEARRTGKSLLPLTRVFIGPRAPRGVQAHVMALLRQQRLRMESPRLSEWAPNA